MLFFVDSKGITEVSDTLIISIICVVLAAVIAFYVLRSLGLYKLAKRQGIQIAYLAFIPFAWIYLAAVLIGDVNFFGKRFSKFALTAVLVISISQIIYFTIIFLKIFPVVGYYMQGGTTYFSTSENVIKGYCATSKIFPTSFGYFGCPDIGSTYSVGFIKTINLLSYFTTLFYFAMLFFTVVLYSNFFRSYLPNHYFIATVFSVLGLFGPFVFAVRNNERVNYAEYIRARYAAFYGMNRNNMNPPESSGTDGKVNDPFEDMGGGDGEKPSDDPFGEFDDKK